MNKDKIIGGWELVVWTMKDEQNNIHYPFGENASGIIMYTPDGYMSANIIADDKKNLISEGVSLESMLKGKGAYLSYSGTYTLYDSRVVHHVRISLIPEWIGGDQERNMKFKNNSLILSSELVLEDGTVQLHSLKWSRVS